MRILTIVTRHEILGSVVKLFYVIYIYTLFKFIEQQQTVKISYHCVSCKKEFNMESASNHVKLTKHEIMEEKSGSWI